MSAVGETLRAARESQGLTLAEVAESIHIRSVYLAAIEAEDWRAIGPPVYARGFLRTYARYLRLDADALSAGMTNISAGAPRGPVAVPAAVLPPLVTPKPQSPKPPRTPPSRSGLSSPERKPGLSVAALGSVLLAVALVVFVVYEYVEFKRGGNTGAMRKGVAAARPQQQAAAGSAEPATAVVPDIRPRAKNEGPSSGFALRLKDGSWLRVVVDGKVAMEGVYPKGTDRTFSGRSATVRAGNAGGVDLWVGGKDLGPMGGLGDVAERSFQL